MGKSGGKRVGAGRHASDGATGTVRTAVMLTPAQKLKLALLGGSVWVRKQLDKVKI